MIDRNRKTRRVWALFVVAAALYGATAYAGIDELRERINTAREALAELAAEDAEFNTAGVEIERARIDVDDAADQIANRYEELAEIAVIRLETRLIFIEAMIERARVDALAESAESDAIDMTREADQAQVDAESTDAIRTRLQEEVHEILIQLEVGQ